MRLVRLAVACLALASARAWAFDVGDVAAALDAVAESRARFTEVRTIAALGAPIERRGTLAYARPDRLEMVVESPIAERVTIAGGKMTVEFRGATRVVDLTKQAPLLAWIEGVRAALAGDVAALRRYFDPTVTGDLERWSMVLVPRDERLRTVLAKITVGGERDVIRSIELDETSGDRSVMTIVPVRIVK